MVREVKALGLETCVTAGMLGDTQAGQLRRPGSTTSHNLDTSPEFYGEIITTRTYQDRLDTLDRVRDAGMKVCSGGIIGRREPHPTRGPYRPTRQPRPAPDSGAPSTT